MIAKSLLLLYCLMTISASEHGGTISGVVVNASSANAHANRVEVVLRASVRGEDFICGQTTTDEEGRFTFDKLPLGEQYVYVPGANRDGVHYPGGRLRLTLERPRQEIELAVRDAVSEPSPLVIRRQEVFIRSEPGALIVTESMTIDNPSQRCYVGHSPDKDSAPITLQLAIPGNFERTTFDQEFYGRRFMLFAGKLLTSIPWPPGKRDLKFTYTLPVEKGFCRWQRPLDLPCELIRVSIEATEAKDVICNLPPASSSTKGEVIYQSSGEILQTGHVVKVEMGRLPVPLMTYARWIAVAVLFVLLIVVGIASFKHVRSEPKQEPQGDHETKPQSNKKRIAA